MKRNTILFLLFFALGCLFLGFGIGKKIYNRPLVETRDTILSAGSIYIPEPEIVEIYIPEPPVLIDTAKIIQDYLKAKVYNDTLVANKEITAILKDTIYKNSVLGRSFTYTLSTPVIRCQQRPFSLYFMADTRMNGSVVFTRKRLLIQGGYDFKYKYPYLGIGLKLY